MSITCYRCHAEVTGGCRCHDGITLIHGDCLEVMPEIEAGSIDMVLCDPPYGTTACAWDSVIPLGLMWKCIEDLIKPNAAIVMMASQPFTTTLISSGIHWFKYCWVWNKKKGGNICNLKHQPYKIHEDVVVFCGGTINYRPIMTDQEVRTGMVYSSGEANGIPDYRDVRTYKKKYPKSIIEISNADQHRKIHPTQKPVALMSYLASTYTNEGETILDFAVGSGTTLVAAKNLGRRSIGIEKELKYVKIAAERLRQGVLFGI